MKKLSNLVVVVFLLIISTPAIIAQTKAPGLQDLIGQKGSGFENSMENRGFYHISTEKVSNYAYSYWWKNKDRQCISVILSDGRIKSIVNTLPADCNKSGNSNGYNHNEHKSYHHNNYSHYNNNGKEVAFERGFNDGKYNKSYHNIFTGDPKNDYTQGYEKGVEERNHKTSYHTGRAGYASHVYVQDLVYQDATTAYRDLKSRGFSQQKEFQDKGVTYRVWYNNSTRQCIKTYSRDYKIYDIKVSTHCN